MYNKRPMGHIAHLSNLGLYSAFSSGELKFSYILALWFWRRRFLLLTHVKIVFPIVAPLDPWGPRF
jgi:hypothetical protein